MTEQEAIAAMGRLAPGFMFKGSVNCGRGTWYEFRREDDYGFSDVDVPEKEGEEDLARDLRMQRIMAGGWPL